MTFTARKSFAALLLAGLPVLLALGGPLAAAPGDDAIAEALAALERGDGIAAELAGKRALDEGASRADVAALIGEGELLQGDTLDARQWLTDAEFTPETRTRGLYARARMELAEENFAAAAEAFDVLAAEDRMDALMWVDVSRMRYRAGQHHLAIDAAREAVALDPQQPRALELLAQLVRDSEGIGKAIPIFRQALEIAPDDLSLMAQYAAALGDGGQHAEMLRVAREMVAQNGDALMAYYLQAILAARAGDDDLARKLWWRTDEAFADTPAGMLVSGVLEYRSGNPALAAESFNRLQIRQPYSRTALLLNARALIANGEANVALELLQPHADRPDASNYLLVLTARAHEQRGEREAAANYLDRAARISRVSLAPMPAYLPRDSFGTLRDPDDPVMRLRELLADGDVDQARAMIGGLLQEYEGSIDVELLAGDVELLGGNPQGAMAYYISAGQVRTNWPLMQRIMAALSMQGDMRQARYVLAAHLRTNPRDAYSAMALGRMHRDASNMARATALLRHAASIGSGASDPLLLADLAGTEAAIGNNEQALAHATRAAALDRGNRHVARALARASELAGQAAIAQAQSAKAQGFGASPQR